LRAGNANNLGGMVQRQKLLVPARFQRAERLRHIENVPPLGMAAEIQTCS
jgi:hypothetical protein